MSTKKHRQRKAARQQAARQLAARRQSRPARAAEVPSGNAESQAADAATVAWMLSAMATLGALLCAGVANALSRWMLGADQRGAMFGALPPLLFFISLVTGSVCLFLTVVALRVRRVPPPSAIVVTAVLIGVSPFVLLLIRGLME
jgi:hypothetical protein